MCSFFKGLIVLRIKMQDHGLMVVRYQSIITENDFPIKTVLGLVVITNWCSNW